ncbi:hypothetical protein EIP86_005587 [Pleurotus ostreatoroseus]|nr:hypothetical protein EIP86_005587 [Pleurotus ostreatoroseus]
MPSNSNSAQSTAHVVRTPTGDATKVTLPFFLNHILPPLPTGLVPTEIVDMLAASPGNSSRKPITAKGRWRGFAQDPADLWQHGNESFRHLKGVVHSILKVSGHSSSIKFHQTRTGLSSRRGRRDEYLPDALLLDGHELGWNSIAAFGELRKGSTSEDIEEQYGLDPTIKRVGDSQRYDIAVHSPDGTTRTFRTVELLAGGNSGAMHCSGTRVWKVIEMEDEVETRRTMALKDSWVGPQQEPEGAIYERFYLDKMAVKQESTTPSPFLTVVCHGDVYMDHPTREALDCTRKFRQPSSMHSTFKSRSEIIEEAVQGAGDQSAPKRLVHYRIVFNEVGKSLDRETSLSKIFQALSRVALALRELHETGWIHRDVSPGNILLDDDGNILLSDLEYAKKMGEGEEFVVVRQLLRFARATRMTPVRDRYPALSARFEKQAAKIQAAREAIKRPIVLRHSESPDPPSDEPTFRYNSLHDMESLWWIAMYFLVKKEIVDPSADGDVSIASEAQRDFAAKLFRQHDRLARDDAMNRHDYFIEGTQTLPSHVSNIVRELARLRNVLWERYSVEETDQSAIDHTCAHGLHEDFRDIFDGLADATKSPEYSVRPFTYIPHSDEDNADDGVIWFSYNVRREFPVQIFNLKRDISATPSDPSIDYAQFQRAKKAKLEDPAQAGTANRVRPYLARRAKKLPTRR